MLALSKSLRSLPVIPYRFFSSQPEDPEILLDHPTPFFTKLTFNRPSSLNALTFTMCETIHALTEKWNKSQNKVVWFCGKGGKAFCAGGDVRALYDVNLTGDPEKMKIHDTFFREEYVCDYKIKSMKPVQISVYDGYVMGGGVGVSINSKVKIATETTVFAMPEAKIGFFTDVSGSFFLSRLKDNFGLFLGLTGHRLKAKELVQVGVANHYVKRENIAKLEQELIASLGPKTTEEEIFRLVSKHTEVVEGKHPLASKINDLFSGETLRDVYRNLEKDQDLGKQLLATLKEFSPSSLRIIFEAIKRGKNMSLDEVFKMEFRLTQRFTQDKDFFEGVRCTLVDRKDKPKWKYNSPFEMPDEEVEKYFARLPEEKELSLN